MHSDHLLGSTEPPHADNRAVNTQDRQSISMLGAGLAITHQAPSTPLISRTDHTQLELNGPTSKAYSSLQEMAPCGLPLRASNEHLFTMLLQNLFVFHLQEGQPVWFQLRPSSEVLLRARAPGARNQIGCPLPSYFHPSPFVPPPIPPKFPPKPPWPLPQYSPRRRRA